MLKFFLKPKKDQAVLRRHPWIFSGAIQRIEGEAQDGDVATVLTHDGQFLAKGHCQQGSITVRILTFQDEELGADFWKKRIENALAYRRTLGLLDQAATNCFRLVHGAGDWLPGLVIDVYGDTAVMQCHSIGMHLQRQLIAETVMELLPNLKAVYSKSADSLPAHYAALTEDGYLLGESGPKTVQENGHSFFVDWETGQKTGFYLDQRDNRQLLARYAAGKKVLNAYCYSGGFSVYALQAGAASVHSIDQSERATEWAARNVELNAAPGSHEIMVGDVQKFLLDCGRYDMMVVDPPAFAKHPGKRHQAVQAYKRLNASALKKIEPGGLLFTFSCSQVIDRQLFSDTIVAAGLEAGRDVRVMHHLSQPADHPVNLFHPEGAYLKGLVLEVG